MRGYRSQRPVSGRRHRHVLRLGGVSLDQQRHVPFVPRMRVPYYAWGLSFQLSPRKWQFQGFEGETNNTDASLSGLARHPRGVNYFPVLRLHLSSLPALAQQRPRPPLRIASHHIEFRLVATLLSHHDTPFSSLVNHSVGAFCMAIYFVTSPKTNTPCSLSHLTHATSLHQ
jgi:hypothetical protein